jgi:hypothetical protein
VLRGVYRVCGSLESQTRLQGLYGSLRAIWLPVYTKEDIIIIITAYTDTQQIRSK